MIVLAAPGLKVPTEHNPWQYVTDTPPEGARGFVVADTAYYRRRIADGDLFEVGESMPETTDAERMTHVTDVSEALPEPPAKERKGR